MLTIKKSTSVNGEVIIDNTLVITLQANISSDTSGSTYINQSVIDSVLYNENKKLCREKVSEFQTEVYRLEDQAAD